MDKIKYASPILLHKKLLAYLSIILFSFSFIYCVHLEKDEDQAASYIFVKSTPKAQIFVNGNFFGMTPNNKIPVSSGSLIELKADGYRTSFVKLGEVKSEGLSVKKAGGHERISISSAGLTIKLKKKK